MCSRRESDKFSTKIFAAFGGVSKNVFLVTFVTLDKSNPHAGSARLKNKDDHLYGNRANGEEAEEINASP